MDRQDGVPPPASTRYGLLSRTEVRADVGAPVAAGLADELQFDVRESDLVGPSVGIAYRVRMAAFDFRGGLFLFSRIMPSRCI
jgi:hypothetical protein